jgi:DamX protein
VAQPAQQTSVPAASQATAPATGGDNWYRSQQPNRYVLQVLGSRSRAAAIDFIAKNSGVAELRFFQTTYQGEPWFVVTQGSYSGRQQAQQGVSTLPASMRSANPWPRSVGDIQKALE